MKPQFLLLLLVLLQSQIPGYSQYKWINPKPQGNTLNSVFFANDQTGYAVGNFGTVIMSVDGGLNFSVIQTNTTKNLNGLYFINENYGFAVGDSGIIIKTIDHGASWTTSLSGVNNNLYSVFFTDSLNGYSCGTNGIILKTTDGGIQWNAMASNVSTTLRSIDFPSHTIGYIVGGGGEAGGYGFVLKSSDSGNNWVLLTDSLAESIYSTDFIDSLTGYASGNMGIVAKTADGGNTWSTLYLYSSSHVHSIKFINPQTGLLCDVNGNIFKTTDAGQTWNKVPSITYNRLFSINKINDSSICVVGRGGQILRSNDYGTNFNILTSPIGELVSINKTDNNHIFVAGDNMLIKTTDGGTNWETHILPELRGCVSAQFVNSSTGYALTDLNGYKIQKSSDSGLTWTTYYLPPLYFNLNDITMVNESLGFIVGGGTNPISTITWGNLLKTTDGTNWSEISGSWPYFNKVYFKNDSTGFLLGGWADGKLCKTTDAGNTWSLVPFDFSNPLVEMIFVSENTGFIAELNSFLKTTDGGLNWNVIYTSNNNNCYGSFDFTDSLNVYFVGVNGNILHTNDGGVSWIAKKSFTNNPLNSILLVNDSSGYIIGQYGNFVSFGKPNMDEVPEIKPGTNLSVSSYPNPFFETIHFELFSNIADIISIELFDLNGRQIAAVKKTIKQGNQVVEFNPGVTLDHGIYTYRITGNKIFNTGKIIKK